MQLTNTKYSMVVKENYFKCVCWNWGEIEAWKIPHVEEKLTLCSHRFHGDSWRWQHHPEVMLFPDMKPSKKLENMT